MRASGRTAGLTGRGLRNMKMAALIKDTLKTGTNLATTPPALFSRKSRKNLKGYPSTPLVMISTKASLSKASCTATAS